MKEVLKQFVPSLICLACEGCCRFAEQESLWRPKALDEEKARFSQGGHRCDESGFLPTVLAEQHHICCFLSLPGNECQVYDQRPWECGLYPFMLIRRDGQVFLAAHLNCPFIAEHKDSPGFQAHVNYLKKYFSHPDVRAILKQNPGMAGDYAASEDEFQILFPVLS